MKMGMDWTPRRKQGLYCAPACGRGCTWKEYHLAKREAERLAAMLGPGWYPFVHENLGWRWSAVSADGRWKVHGGWIINRKRRSEYIAYLGHIGNGGGYWSAEGRTPRAAVRHCWEKAKAELDYWASYGSAVDVISDWRR